MNCFLCVLVSPSASGNSYKKMEHSQNVKRFENTAKLVSSRVDFASRSSCVVAPCQGHASASCGHMPLALPGILL
uniref:Putative secreted protein n=1 Tax=Ixodes ricinus TaxID=34613 RepID=A0A6B0TTF2_IXORI